MNNLYEYIDPSPLLMRLFFLISTRDSLPIPAHWHYYVELLYVLKGEIEVSLDNVTSIGTEGSCDPFPPKCVHSIALAKGSVPVQYDVIKFDPNLLPPARRMSWICVRFCTASTRSAALYFSPEQVQKMDLFPLFRIFLRNTGIKSLAIP